ncbi:MAG TPA: alpha/beta fold hydrolase [Polyangia bacterium]|nr:alpha/beta fold hydrolase [Polyangia bacterium]
MKRTVLVIHGAGEPRRRGGKIYWEPLLQHSLGAGYVVHAPPMPHPDDPHHAPWAKRIEELIAAHGRPVVVGHSFGASTLLKFFSEAAAPPAVPGLFLISTPFWGPKFPEFTLKPNFASRLRDVPLFFYQTRDDQVVPVAQLEQYRRALPHATVRLLDGRGHEFDQPDFPELAADIRSLTGTAPP